MRKVDILLATYKPNSEYFAKQLKSLNEQTYGSIKLLIRDDSGDELEFNKVKFYLEKYITNFHFELYKNDTNIGSNKTFELLTQDANSYYIAYCDQDDIWEKEKITKLVNAIEDQSGVVVYSDLAIIDKDDYVKARSFKDINKRLNHLDGENLFRYFLRRNSITGCTMLIESKIAKLAIPFCNDFFVHDHWLALFSSSKGKVIYVNEPLVKYRIHSNNQIGSSMLSNISNKNEYYEKKLIIERRKYKHLINNYEFNSSNIYDIMYILKWTEERIDFFENKNLKNFIKILKRLKEDYQLMIFEMLIVYLPIKLSSKLINSVKK